MCDSTMMQEYGLVGSFDTVAMMSGERIAIVMKRNPNNSFFYTPEDNFEQTDLVEGGSLNGEYECSEDEESEVEEVELQGMSYTEIQYFSQSLSKQLYYRFGVRTGDRVILACQSHASAEVVAMLACARIGAIFVPIDYSWLHSDKSRLASIIQDATPSAAVVVGDDDQSEVVLALGKLGVYRCALVTNEGSLVEQDASVSSTTENQFSEYNPEKARENGEKEVPLYILYTSGSTGEPKGVLGTYKGLINRICWQIDKYPWQIGEVACRRTPLTFVDAMAEIFGALLCCVPLFLPDAEKMKSEGVSGIAEEANSAGVTRITLLPSQLYMACKLNSDIGSTWPKLRYVYISGEECQWLLVDLFRKVFPNCTLINLYGSTEVAGDVTFAELYKPDSSVNDTGHSGDNGNRSGTIISSVSNGNSDVMSKFSHCVPIGLPIKNNYLFIVKRTENTSEDTTNTNTTDINTFSLCKDGEEGELMVLGEHVSAGYYNRPLENSQKFVDNPLRNMSDLQSGSITDGSGKSNSDVEEALKFEKAFLTGDLVVRDPSNHQLIWISRLDRQIKIRGVRIELEDVERNISRVCRVADGIAVIAVKTTNNDNTNNTNNTNNNSDSISTGAEISTNTLVLFVEQHIVNTVTSNNNDNSATSANNSSNTNNITAFRQFLSQHLSAYMLPTHIIAVDSLPRTVSKKVDRQQLTRQYNATISSINNDNNNNSSGNNNDDVSEKNISGNTHNAIDINSITQSEMHNLLLKTFISVLPKESVESTTFSTATTANLTSIDHSQHSFVSLGGDSMTSIEVIYKLRSILGGKIHLKYEDLVSNSITELAKYIYKLIHSDIIYNTATSDEGDATQQANKKQKKHHDIELNTPNNSNVNNSNITVCYNKINSDNIVEAYAVSRASNTTKVNAVNTASNNVHNNIKNNSTSGSNSSNSNELKVVWKCPLLKCVDSSPLIIVRSYGNIGTKTNNNNGFNNDDMKVCSNTTVYIGSHGGDFTAIDGDSGAIHWQTQLHQHIEAAAIANLSCSLIYIVSYAGKDVDGYEGTAVLDSQSGEPCLGTIWALNAYDGSVVWKHHTAGELKGAVTIDHEHNVLFCGSYDGNLYCLDASSGRELSRVACHGAIFASPVLSGCGDSKISNNSSSDKVYVVTTSGLVQAIRVEISTIDLNTTNTYNSESIAVKMSVIGVYSSDSSPIFSTPIVVDTVIDCNGIDGSNKKDSIGTDNSASGNSSKESLLFGVIDGSIRAVTFEPTSAATTGNITCDTTATADTAEAGMEVNDSDVCFDEEKSNLFDNLNLPLQSNEHWRIHNSHGAVFSSPCLVPTSRNIDSESRVFVSDNCAGSRNNALQLTDATEKMVGGASFVVGAHDGRLRHIDIATGTLLWEVNLNIVIFSAPFCTTTHCIVTTTAGEVVVLCVRTGDILSKLRLAGEIYSSPVVVNGFVYVGCRDDHVYCLKM